MKDFEFDGKNYSGTLKFTIYDHFWLDDDINKFHPLKNLSPFKSWYILQHYDGFKGQYKPFITYIEFEVPFCGTVKED